MTNSVDAIYCKCGYLFQPEKVDGVDSELEMAAQDEELYEAYLAARADQAAKDAQQAVAALATDPRNHYKAEQAEQAMKIAEAANEEYTRQTKRTAAAVKVAKSARTRSITTMLETSKTKDKPPTKVLSATPIPRHVEPVLLKNTAPTPVKQNLRPGPIFKKQQAVKAARAIQINNQIKSKQVRRNAAAIKEELEAQSEKTAVAIEAARAARARHALPKQVPLNNIKQKVKTVANNHAAPITLRPRTEDVSHIKANQRKPVSRQPQKITPSIPETPKEVCPICSSSYPQGASRCSCGYDFKAISAQLPSLTKGEGANTPAANSVTTKECPHCTGSRPVDAERCSCGYVFNEGISDLPSLSLSNSDINTLVNTSPTAKSSR